MNNNVNEIGQSFVYESEYLGHRVVKELIPNGHDILITEENKKDFIRKTCDEIMRNQIQEQLAAFKRGFNLVIDSEYLELFSVSELELLISGAPEINFQEMKQYAAYRGMDENDPVAQLFWEVVGEFSQKELASLIYFISGNFLEITCNFLGSVKVPYGGFKERTFYYKKGSSDRNILPEAHTW